MWQSTCSGVQFTYAGGGQATNVLSCSDGSCSNVILHTCLSSDGQSGSGMWDSNTTSHAVLTGKVRLCAPCEQLVPAAWLLGQERWVQGLAVVLACPAHLPVQQRAIRLMQ